MPGEMYTYWLSQDNTKWTHPGRPDLSNIVLRDPLKWPYPSDSFWNMPIGDGATFAPLNFPIIATNQYKFRWEEEVLTLDPDAPEQNIMAHNAGWTGAIRCASRTGGVLVGNGTVSDVSIPVPAGFTTDPAGLPNGYLGTTPNHGSAHVRRRSGDVVLLECQPTHICTDGVPVAQFVNSTWVGDSIMTGGDGVKGGSHGGSYLSAFGGTIRCHEWKPGGRIPHATKIVLNTSYACYNHDTQNECFTWPATRADSGAVTSYGDTADPSLPPEARMGMLVTLPTGWDYNALLTQPARILARSIYEYGTYLCDGDHGLDVFMFSVEWSNEGRLLNDFSAAPPAGFGIKGFHRGADGVAPPEQVKFWADMDDIFTALVVVTNNSEANPGGPGTTRRAPIAPPLGPMP